MGGGVGISISDLRETSSSISSSDGKSSGPIAFLELYDVVVKIVKAGGFRRGALLSLLDYNRPDIEDFIQCKGNVDKLNNMNISVLVKDEFFDLLDKDEMVPLVSPKTKDIVDQIPASLLFEDIATNMWATGEPGLLFYDAINKANPTPHLGDIRVCNPCGEATLLNGEACCLGSINLANHVEDGEINWDKLAYTTKLAVRFLDNVLTGSPYPNTDIEIAVKTTRKVGLGIMGFADLLIKLNVLYESKEAVEIAGKVMSFINDVAGQTSTELGEEKGIYPGYKEGYRKRRNSIVTTIAPTGSLSLIANVSSGVEPNFPPYSRLIDNTLFKVESPYSKNEFFQTTYDISLDQHINILAEFQKHVENAISKTINCPERTTVSEIKEVILKAHKLGCKGLTVYRQNCSREELIRCEDCKL